MSNKSKTKNSVKSAAASPEKLKMEKFTMPDEKKVRQIRAKAAK